jgi:hypothetical protein|tara:strand:+ start:7377 stop:7559 length:183 start_codon:yes stop_codon:yes gene_type:complete
MILLKITPKEKPVLLEALHFFAAELAERMKNCGEDDISSRLKELDSIDQIIDVIQLTEKK